MKVVYIAHPLGSGPDRERWVAWAANKGCTPAADWITETPENRTRGLLIDVVREVWLVGGRVSPGMQIEADAAKAVGITVVDFTHLGPEPPERGRIG